MAVSLAHANDADSYDPSYDRPGLGFAPEVLPAGAVTIEQGLPDWTRGKQDGMTTALYSANSLLRVGLSHQLELQVGDSFYNRLHMTDATSSDSHEGRGDSTLGIKYALPSAATKFTWGLLGNVEFTDGQRDFRNPHKQYELGLQLNLQANEKNSLGAYLEEQREGGGDSQIIAVSDDYKLSPAWAIYAEAAQEHDAGNRSGALAGGGVTWQLGRHVQLDSGVRHRIGGEVNQWEAELGASVYLGK